jgi:hypothetical protein
MVTVLAFSSDAGEVKPGIVRSIDSLYAPTEETK